jgi:tRNA dimethylallyltransferase
MKPILVIAGPTAAGKSALAVSVAQHTGGEIICADAYQLYAGLPILTAQPSAEEQAAVPHHLYGTVPPGHELDAAAYARRAETCIADIHARGRLPILCGGSGLYLKALTHGLAPLPPGDPALRARLAERTAESLVAELLTLDPAAAQTINLKNPRYVERALEICLLTGRPASEQRTNFHQGPRPGYTGHLLLPERTALCARIDARTPQMFDAGVVEEVRALPPAGQLSATAAKTLGLREIQSLITGTTTRDAAITAIQLATRQYAKRQATWFRREHWMHIHSTAESLLAAATTG